MRLPALTLTVALLLVGCGASPALMASTSDASLAAAAVTPTPLSPSGVVSGSSAIVRRPLPLDLAQG
ncbi:MAG: hypothetical protein KGR26_14085, partial [Cyanobacteria bacterium REEB65]|nr:hypothetical protein [Cyanobacteria bacterium REEB65]